MVVWPVSTDDVGFTRQTLTTIM